MKNLFTSIADAYYEKKYDYMFLYILRLVAIATFSTVLTLWLIFLISHNMDIILTVGTVWMVLYFLYVDYKKKKELQGELEAQQLEAIRIANEEAERNMHNANYDILRNCIFIVVSELYEVLGVVKPTRLSELNSPSKVISKGDAIVSQFVLLKKGGNTLDCDIIQQILQQRITQMLNAMEFSGIKQSAHFFDGQAYPFIMIDSVEDINSYFQIDVAIASDNYCRILMNRQYMKLETDNKSNPFDKDFR